MKRKAFIILSVLALLFSFTFATGGVATAASGSQDVVIIGGPVVINGGTLQPASFPGGSTYNFSNMGVSEINAANLTKFDTVLLNMASSLASDGCGCDSSRLSSQAKADLNQFVFNGGKLIIYDSECTFGGSVDYTWLIYPFTTNNPGAQGARGTLSIVEENCLSENDTGDTYYIDAGYLGSSTDAVGDMNVMVTLDSHWCLDMAGTNTNDVTGPVHTYARYGSGLIIYNGLDVDAISSEGTTYGLKRILEQELNVGFDPVPACLPCGITVTGLSLTPVTDTNCVDTDHTLTARVTNNLGQGVPGASVNITIIAGPHVGQTSGALTTDANGYATWTYHGTSVGTDTIEVSGNGPAGTPLVAAQAEKIWEECGEPPVVEVGGTVQPVNKFMLLTPWITLGILLAAWGTFILRRRKAQS